MIRAGRGVKDDRRMPRLAPIRVDRLGHEHRLVAQTPRDPRQTDVIGGLALSQTYLQNRLFRVGPWSV